MSIRKVGYSRQRVIYKGIGETLYVCERVSVAQTYKQEEISSLFLHHTASLGRGKVTGLTRGITGTPRADDNKSHHVSSHYVTRTLLSDMVPLCLWSSQPQSKVDFLVFLFK